MSFCCERSLQESLVIQKYWILLTELEDKGSPQKGTFVRSSLSLEKQNNCKSACDLPVQL